MRVRERMRSMPFFERKKTRPPLISLLLPPPPASFLSTSKKNQNQQNRPGRAQALPAGPRIPTPSLCDRPGRRGVPPLRLGLRHRGGPAPQALPGRESGAARRRSLQGHRVDDARAQGHARSPSPRRDQAYEREVGFCCCWLGGVVGGGGGEGRASAAAAAAAGGGLPGEATPLHRLPRQEEDLRDACCLNV